MIFNGKNGEKLSLEIISGIDAAKIAMDCFLSVYGNKDNYPFLKFDADWLANEIRSGQIKVFIGKTDDGCVVTASAKRHPYFRLSWEICAIAVTQQYRGFALGEQFTRYVLEQ
jgi:hypothetical protein